MIRETFSNNAALTKHIARTLMPKTTKSRLIGHVDVLQEDRIAGWAHDVFSVVSNIKVDIFIAGRLVATLTADNFRPDLLAAGLGDGHKAFEFDPSDFINSENDEVRITFALTGKAMPGGCGKLSKSKIRLVEDWDAAHTTFKNSATPMERLSAFPSDHWPTISVLLPTYNTEPQFLIRATQSVLQQTYSNWQLCIADDGSKAASTLKCLRDLSTADSRINVTFQPANRGISKATNAALHFASGEYVAFLDHDDELAPDALAEVAAGILAAPQTDVFYSDQDKCNEAGDRFEPFHKPAWSPVYFLGAMYVGHLLVARTSLVRQLGGCDYHFDKVQDYELMLRLSELTDRIAHIPKILYHWRALSGSIASSPYAKGQIEHIQAAAAQAHLDRRGLPLRVKPHPWLPHRLQLYPTAPARTPRVSIIILSGGAIHRCLGSIFEQTTYRDFEVFVVESEDANREASQLHTSFPIRELRDDRPFNISSASNYAARLATGEALVFLSGDTEIVTPDWLEILLAHLTLPNVGAVGPLLVCPQGKVVHAGLVIGFRGTADGVMRGLESTSDGYAGSLCCSREVSAVSANCMMVRSNVFRSVGGMNESYTASYQDVDLCLRIRKRHHSVLYVSNVMLTYYEHSSHLPNHCLADRQLFIDQWRDEIAAGDPFYNINFTRNSTNYTLR